MSRQMSIPSIGPPGTKTLSAKVNDHNALPIREMDDDKVTRADSPIGIRSGTIDDDPLARLRLSADHFPRHRLPVVRGIAYAVDTLDCTNTVAFHVNDPL